MPIFAYTCMTELWAIECDGCPNDFAYSEDVEIYSEAECERLAKGSGWTQNGENWYCTKCSQKIEDRSSKTNDT